MLMLTHFIVCLNAWKFSLIGVIVLLRYKNFSANLMYSAATKSYFGEFEHEHIISFQATNREQAIQIMRFVVDDYFLQILG